MNYLITLFLSAALVVMTGCVTNEPNLPSKVDGGDLSQPSVLVESYKMAVGDQLQINVWKNDVLSLSQPIRPDGKISMPLIGDVLAVGLTPEELAGRIEVKLSDYVKAPNVTVILTSLQGHAFLSRIRVTGSVAQNVSMQYHQGMTVLDAILEAGSVDLYADANNTKLHRRTKKGAVTYDIRLKNIMQEGDMSTNISLMPGDIITVPERSF
jgi:polysaccharide export outer membrane protein